MKRETTVYITFSLNGTFLSAVWTSGKNDRNGLTRCRTLKPPAILKPFLCPAQLCVLVIVDRNPVVEPCPKPKELASTRQKNRSSLIHSLFLACGTIYIYPRRCSRNWSSCPYSSDAGRNLVLSHTAHRVQQKKLVLSRSLSLSIGTHPELVSLSQTDTEKKWSHILDAMYSQDEKQLQKDKLQGEMRLPQKLLTSSLEEAPNSTIQTSKLAQELVDLVSHLPEFRYTYRNTRK